MKFNLAKFFLLTIILSAVTLRLYGLDWDQGNHLHPDERAIVMFSLPLHFPQSFSEFLTPESPLNPHFFAYGNLPIYLLKIIGTLLSNFNPLYLSYDKINLVGRAISATADLGTLVLLYLLTKKLFNQNIGFISSFFYAFSVFPIQASHFYAVDVLLTFFVFLTVYQLIRFYEKPSLKNAVLVGLSFGASLATKISAIPLIGAITAALAIDFLLIVLKQPHKPHIWFPHIPHFLKKLLFDGLIILTTTLIAFIVLQPYSIIDFQTFLRQNLEQSQMTRSAFTFPYTLQYVGKLPYLYELKNIFFWGQGPILATLSFLGIFYVIYKTIKQPASPQGGSNNKTIILLTFFLIYFAVVGKFAVGWMRYMLPLYPLLSLFAAIISYKLLMALKEKFRYWKLVVLVCIGSILVWPLSFMHIYTKPNTRVLASEWIYKNIPEDKIIAREHWDDGLPIGGSIIYKTLDLPIYEMENLVREMQIYQSIRESDYIIIASNRLYVPLQRIAKNCETWRMQKERCPKNANIYYEKLFNGALGFEKVAEFTASPQLSIFNFQFSIDDSSADESFTVYDHPKVMIFKKQ